MGNTAPSAVAIIAGRAEEPRVHPLTCFSVDKERDCLFKGCCAWKVLLAIESEWRTCRRKAPYMENAGILSPLTEMPKKNP
ncbi:hypothetical protein HMPREF9141_0206 [Prevotella multiformis DSM 16608]|uniref:Uncharacterized protein n=1 Tax=Prevotella multiformis DSM 16608 TaxID=888743 RepID=F0F3P0_9BACT|nr:hypothetical protein HMPREF9141_0206 [Prevotella multiformis DSM 16608]